MVQVQCIYIQTQIVIDKIFVQSFISFFVKSSLYPLTQFIVHGCNVTLQKAFPYGHRTITMFVREDVLHCVLSRFPVVVSV